MPYTPPSQQSPVASLPESPKLSRSQSYSKAESPSTSPSGSALPRSTSYLSRHRRTGSVKRAAFAVASSPPAETAGSEGQRPSGLAKQSAIDTNGSLHQAPSPVNDLLIPSGAVISPPNSSPSSSEDEGDALQGVRQLENLAELQAAVRIIEQHREHKPDMELQIPDKNGGSSPPRVLESTSLPKEPRQRSHARSSTENNILYELEKQPETPSRSSDDSDVEDDELRIKPPMVRKKSGELVKPALRPSSHRRPSSMPGTPTYGKAVHFDSHLEHIRHFLKVDRPVAVSAGSSPVETHDGEPEFPWSHEDSYHPRSPPFEWEIRLSNFPADTPERRAQPVRVERVFLSADNRNLIGTVAVANISFQKFVAVRFTLDYWKTTSEVVAEYNNDVRRKQVNDGYDRFNFSIKLTDQANLENKTMFFCVRYNVNGQELWDSNGSMNFQVDFSKKAKPQNGKQGMQGAAARPLNALPRSRPSPPTSSGTGRPRSMPVSFDDFAGSFDNKYDFGLRQPPPKVIDESPSSTIRFKNSKPARSVIPDRIGSPPTATPGQAFGNRYDFGASLSAAIQAANSALGDRSGLNVKNQSNSNPEYFKGNEMVEKPSTAQSHRMRTAAQGNGNQANQAKANAAPTNSLKPDALTSQKPSLQSSSYHELLDKYCFFGSGKSSPQLESAPPAQTDGASDGGFSRSNAKGGKQSSSGPSKKEPSEEQPYVPRSESPRFGRSPSPAPMTGSGLGSRTSSPMAFGYPYRQGMHGGFFTETHTPTAIRGQ